MDSDSRKMRGAKPFIFTNMKRDEGVDRIISFIIEQGMLSEN